MTPTADRVYHFFFHGIYLQVFLSDLIILEEENAIKYTKKASAQNRAKALKIMRFLGLVASQRELLPLAPRKSILNTFVYEIYQRVFILFELSVKHTLSDFLLPFCCHKVDKCIEFQ